MKKNLIILITTLSLLTTSVPTFASTTQNLNNNSTNLSTVSKSSDEESFLESDAAKALHARKLDKLPKDAKVLKFNTWDEALNFVKSTKANLDSKYTKNNSLALKSESPDDELGTDYYGVGYVSFGSGSGTVPKKVNWDVPGASYQTIYSEHYFDYSDGVVTNSSRGSRISGVGLSTWTSDYSGLTHPESNEWHSIIKGTWGYYVSVSGHNVGLSATLGLMAICSHS